jgi:ribose 5-phosphate isomerase
MPKLKEPISTNKTKRKKDGVFYTQNNKYIVDNTVGKQTLHREKLELGIIDEEYASVARTARQQQL